MHTHRVLAVIEGETGFDHTLNWRSTPEADWSRDSSLLLWSVYGKWVPYTLTLLKVDNGQVQWQRNVLKLAQQAILARTQAATPIKYAAAKISPGSLLYPDGFTVDVEVLKPIAFPVRLRAALTSDVKGVEDRPMLQSHLDARIDEQGNLTVTDFGLGHPSWPAWHKAY